MRTKLWKQRADLREGCKLCMGPKTGEALGFRGAISGLHPKKEWKHTQERTSGTLQVVSYSSSSSF